MNLRGSGQSSVTELKSGETELNSKRTKLANVWELTSTSLHLNTSASKSASKSMSEDLYKVDSRLKPMQIWRKRDHVVK